MTKRSLIMASALAIGGILPLACNAGLTPATASGWGVDDWNTSTLIPNQVNNGKNTPTYYTAAPCPWITTAMNAFVAANANYTYQWAAPFANLQSDLKVTDYSAWVVTSPNTANGFALSGGVTGQDVGGADFGLTYTPKNGDPTSVFFIQAYLANRNGVIAAPALDNGGGATPWYGGASSYTAAVSKMGDEPYRTEVETQDPSYYANFQFQTVVAIDTKANGKDNLTLYQASEWWGYNYTTTDISPVPEPSTWITGALLLLPFGARTIRMLRQKN